MGRLSFIMAVALMACCVSLVTSRYQARQLFIELGRGQSQASDLDTEWRRLQLDRAELARNARVDSVARDELKMIPITPERTIYLTQAPVDPASVNSASVGQTTANLAAANQPPDGQVRAGGGQ